MREAKLFLCFFGCVSWCLWISKDALSQVCTDTFGITWLLGCVLLCLVLYSSFKRTSLSAAIGTQIVSSAFFTVPFLNFLYFHGKSLSEGMFVFALVIVIIGHFAISTSVFSLFEKMGSENENKKPNDIEKTQRPAAEMQNKAHEEHQRQLAEENIPVEEMVSADLYLNVNCPQNKADEQQCETPKIPQYAIPIRKQEYAKPSRPSYASDCKYFVKVKFPNSEKTYDYICDDKTVEEGDCLYVDSKYGRKKAQVVKTFYQYMDRMPLPSHVYKTVHGSDRVKDGEDFYCNDIKKRTETSNWDGYCVDVNFDADGNDYSYRCPFSYVDEGDYVQVRARGKVKTARVARRFYDPDATWSMVIGLATDEQIDRVRYLFEEDDEDDELSWEDEEEFRREMEEDERRYRLEEEEDLREIRAQEAGYRYYGHQASRTSWDNWDNDDWGRHDDDDDGRMFDSRGNMINGKLREYERHVRETGIADTEYELELRDGYRYCDDHDDYDDCHFGSDSSSSSDHFDDGPEDD